MHICGILEKWYRWTYLESRNRDQGVINKHMDPTGDELGDWDGHTHTAAAAAKLLQSCPTLRDPRDGSLPGAPVPGILQAIVWNRSLVRTCCVAQGALLNTPWWPEWEGNPRKRASCMCMADSLRCTEENIVKQLYFSKSEKKSWPTLTPGAREQMMQSLYWSPENLRKDWFANARVPGYLLVIAMRCQRYIRSFVLQL